MTRQTRPITILMADDDPDDRQMTRDAFAVSRVANDLRFVNDGVELMDYLLRRNQFSDPAVSPRPGLFFVRHPATRRPRRARPAPKNRRPPARRLTCRQALWHSARFIGPK